MFDPLSVTLVLVLVPSKRIRYLKPTVTIVIIPVIRLGLIIGHVRLLNSGITVNINPQLLELEVKLA